MKHLVLSILALSIFPVIGFGQSNASEYENQAGINGAQNSAFGQKAGASNENKDNVFVGFGSGAENNGNNNVFVGSQSGTYNSKGSSNVFLGFNSGIKTEDLSNLLYIENSSSNKPLIWGDFKSDIVNINGRLGIDNNNPQEVLHINGNIRGNQQSGALRINTTAGYIDIGPKNTSWAHIYTDRPKFIFNKDAYTITGGFSSYSTSDLSLKTNGATRLTVKNATGNVGIGTTSPGAGLEVKNDAGILIQAATNGGFKGSVKMIDVITNAGSAAKDDMLFGTPGGFQFKIDTNGNGVGEALGFNVLNKNNESLFVVRESNGNVGIGTTIPDEKLTVKGKIHTQEVRVDLDGVIAPDYVFEKYYLGESSLKMKYTMPTLEELEVFTKKNHHLPEIPSSKEMEEHGIQLKEMNMKLLQKIEELTLYTIQQEKEIQQQRNEVKYLKTELEDRLDKMELLIENLNK